MTNLWNTTHTFATETEAKVYYAKEVSRGRKNISLAGNTVIEWPIKANDEKVNNGRKLYEC